MHEYSFLILFAGILFCLFKGIVSLFKNKQMKPGLRGLLIFIFACMSVAVIMLSHLMTSFFLKIDNTGGLDLILTLFVLAIFVIDYFRGRK